MKTLTLTIETGVSGPAVRALWEKAPDVYLLENQSDWGEDGGTWTKFGYHERGVLFYTREVAV